MDRNGEGSGKKKPSKRKRGRRAPHPHVHPVELRRKAVQLCVEEGFPVAQVARDLRVGLSTLGKWIRTYRTQGGAGLEGKARQPRNRKPQVAPAVKAQVVAVKRRHPDFGIQKISQFLRRMCLLPISRETVRRELQGQIACRVFQDARPALQAYTLCKRREVFDEINALTWTLLQAQGGCTQDEADSIRRVAVEAWLQQHQVITITQNHRVLPPFLKRTAHN